MQLIVLYFSILFWQENPRRQKQGKWQRKNLPPQMSAGLDSTIKIKHVYSILQQINC